MRLSGHITLLLMSVSGEEKNEHLYYDDHFFRSFVYFLCSYGLLDIGFAFFILTVVHFLQPLAWRPVCQVVLFSSVLVSFRRCRKEKKKSLVSIMAKKNDKNLRKLTKINIVHMLFKKKGYLCL